MNKEISSDYAIGRIAVLSTYSALFFMTSIFYFDIVTVMSETNTILPAVKPSLKSQELSSVYIERQNR